ncbi:lysosomal-associated transmembrane protein 4A [Exaiptasia diaphana]|uniref:Lysosomal-associated transmembrane protein 4A n=1 Tax=Exaiptasia diaphana TaxID=2652724 RepID=A0A913Y193_EXADI|nr:lysosomal-associated transmembrane protein 4A [Exaiptasia diaphana]KXJ29190.1 Lysosomal-associated transmembrane protein 4B [Exaiptasia diaphana]
MKLRRTSEDLDDDGTVMKTCCCCMDVRIGTIVLGFCHLLIHIAGVVVLTQMLLHPEMYEERYYHTYGTVPRSADNSVALAIAFCSFVITTLLIYGAITRQPSYLLPFFCLQMFDFCVNLLGAVGAVSYIPEIKLMIKNNPNFPYGEEVDRVDMRSLMMTVILLCLIVLLIKGYLIACVWSCYKSLVNYRVKQATRTFMLEVEGDDTETHVLLPNYEDAVKDTPKESPPPYTTSS